MRQDDVIGMAALAGIVLVTAWLGSLGRRAPPKPKQETSPLDAGLFRWGANDTLTVRDYLNGGISIVGRAGSGKTSSSGRMLGKAIVEYPRSGGLILAAKPEDLEMWRAIFQAANREDDDLLVFGPDSPLRFNFLAYVLAMGGDTRAVTKCITTVGETLRTADTKGGESADFWEREQERMLFNAVEIIRLATGTVSAPDIQRFIGSAPQSPDAIATEQWQEGFCNECIRGAYEKSKTVIEQHDFDLATDYWLSEFPTSDSRTRSNILTGVMGVLHVFNTGVVRELVSQATNVSPDDILAGKWVLVNMSPAEWGDTGALVASGWKYLTQKAVLRRKTDDNSSVVTVWCDEAAQFVNSFDSHFITQCRSHMGCLVFLTQSLHSYFTALKGKSGEHQAKALLTNFGTKIFHALGDTDTAQWGSGLVGKSLQTFVGGSMSPMQNIYMEMLGQQRMTTSTNEHYEAQLQLTEFMHGLRTGGPPDFIADAIVIRSGTYFSNGYSYMLCGFSQKG